jgi:endoglucanase
MAGTDQVVILYTDRGNGSVNANQATMTLHVQNAGAAFDLTDLTMRYWFTDDGQSDFIAEIDYAAQTNGSSFSKTDVSVTFAEESGSNYALIGFTAGDSVGPEGVDQVQVRIHTNNYAMLDQSNDFSFLGNGSATANRNITPYINGVQVGGCVPLPP